VSQDNNISLHRPFSRREAIAILFGSILPTAAGCKVLGKDLTSSIKEDLQLSSGDENESPSESEAKYSDTIIICEESLPSSETDIPEWDGDYTFVSSIGKAEMDVECPAGQIMLSPLDALGRSGRAVGNITHSMAQESSNWRSAFEDEIEVAGWPKKNPEVTISVTHDGTEHAVDRTYVWNRCHLIADCLGGYLHAYMTNGDVDTEMSVTPAEDVFCGTRCANVGPDDADGLGYWGMAHVEDMVLEFLYGHDDIPVWYSAEPVYDGDELIPRAIVMQAKSADGAIDLCEVVHNVLPGFEIDYDTAQISRSIT